LLSKIFRDQLFQSTVCPKKMISRDTAKKNNEIEALSRFI